MQYLQCVHNGSESDKDIPAKKNLYRSQNPKMKHMIPGYKNQKAWLSQIYSKNIQGSQLK